MILLTYIGRVQDGLILTATMDDDDQVRRSTTEYQTQAKMLLKKLDFDSPPRSSIETGPYIWHYLIEKSVCYLVLCEKTFSKRLAFAFLEDIQNEFSSHYGSQVERYSRPYHCIEFDTYIQKTKKTYVDSRARRNLNTINTELQDVQRIMVQNIDDVLQRGSALSELDSKASNLSILSQKYKKDARYLNLTSTFAKVAAAAVILFCFTMYFWIL